MIVIVEPASLVVVQQTDHAHLSGELLSLWVVDDLPSSPLRGEVVFAGRHHDNGWREEDAAPRLDPETGFPHTFQTLPAAPRREIWRRGIRRYADSHPFAAALIHQHALALHRSIVDDASHAGLVAEVRASLAALLERHALDPAAVGAAYPWIDLTDLASLVACRQFRAPVERAGRRLWLEGGSLHIDPFPLAGATRFSLSCREIERRRYRSDRDLATALARAVWTSRGVHVAPAAPRVGER